MCKSLIFTEFSNIANQIAVKKKIARTLNSASQPMKKRRALFSSVDSLSQGKRFLVHADNGGLVARGKAPFPFSFLDLEISKFRKDLLLFFSSKVEFDFWGVKQEKVCSTRFPPSRSCPWRKYWKPLNVLFLPLSIENTSTRRLYGCLCRTRAFSVQRLSGSQCYLSSFQLFQQTRWSTRSF